MVPRPGHCAIVISGTEMLLKAMSGRMARVSVLMSMAPAITEGHAYAWHLGYHQGPGWCPWVMLLQEPCQSEYLCYPLGSWWHPCVPAAEDHSGSMSELQPGSVLKYVSCVVTQGHRDAQGLCCNLGPCWVASFQSHAGRSNLCCHPGPWCHTGPSSC